MTDTAIRVENLSKLYYISVAQERHDTLRDTVVGLFHRRSSPLPSRSSDTDLWALKNVTFEVKRGDVVGIIGRNGAGKSTLLKILSRITEPTQGRVALHGRVASLLEVGTGFHPELTGRENIYLNGAILGMKRREIDRKFDEIVDFAEIERFLDMPVKRYSSGMYVRLAFAVAAHLESDILLVDEVLAVGDSWFQKKCLGKIGDVTQQGKTVIFVSHNMAAVSSLCNNGVILDRGELGFAGNVRLAIMHYQSALQANEDIPLMTRLDRRGNGAIRFSQIRFCSGGPSLHQPVVTGGDLSVSIECISPNGSVVQNVDIAVTILDLNGLPLLTCFTQHRARSFSELPPMSRIQCDIPVLQLLPGEYQIDVWASVEGEEADYVQHASRLTIAEGDFFGTGKLPIASKHGPFLVEHHWRICD